MQWRAITSIASPKERVDEKLPRWKLPSLNHKWVSTFIDRCVCMFLVSRITTLLSVNDGCNYVPRLYKKGEGPEVGGRYERSPLDALFTKATKGLSPRIRVRPPARPTARPPARSTSLWMSMYHVTIFLGPLGRKTCQTTDLDKHMAQHMNEFQNPFDSVY